MHGLEMALDEISYDLALSNGRILTYGSSENTCCKLPGTEFLSPKFWKRTENQLSTSRLSPCGATHSPHANSSPFHDASSGVFKTENQKGQHPYRDGFVLNPLADKHEIQGTSGFHSNGRVKNIFQDVERLQVRNTGGLSGVPSSAAC